jgi:beta-galactosidase
MIEKLRTFVEKGGTLVSTFRSFFSDRDSTARCDRQPHAMTDLFGISYQSFVEPDRLYAGEKECRAFAELIVPKEAKVLLQYRHRYWGKYAAATINSFGEGEAVYIGAMLDKSVLKKLLAGIGSLNDLRAQEAVFADKGEKSGDAYENAPISWPLIVRSGKNSLGREVHYLLHYSEDDGSYRCPYEKVTDLLTGKSYRRGDEIALSDWSVQVLEED